MMPLLKDSNILTTLKTLDKKRRKYYLKADLKIKNSETPKKTILFLKEFFSKVNV